MEKNKKKYPIENFSDIYPDYDVCKLPNWIRENIQNVKVTGYKNRSLFLPDGRHYNLCNKLNDLSGADWSKFINSTFFTAYPTRGKEGYAHELRKKHPSPKPPQLMRDIILFFTKENEIVLDTFMGVGGTLLGASLCNRRGVGIDLSSEYIDIYKKANSLLKLKEQKTYVGDCLSILRFNQEFKKRFHEEKASLILIDPPYANMMSKEKTGGDGLILGKNGTPFTSSDKDLGNMEHNDFLKSLKCCVQSSLKYLKDKGYLVVFIKDLQPKGKDLNMLHYDIAYTLNKIKNLNYKGMKIWADLTAKIYPYGYPYSFVANQIHQYILIFRKEF